MLRKLYRRITPSNTQWLPRYYTALRLVRPAEGPVLDASCGEGSTAIELKRRGADVIGIDISEKRIMIARQKAKTEGMMIDFIIGDLTRCPLGDGTFNQIISLDTMEHIHDDRAVIKEFARLLKPNGILILSVPHGATNSAELFWEQRVLRRLIPRFLYTKASYNGKSWLEATREDAMIEMGHLRDYYIDKLERETQSIFKIKRHEYGLKKFSAISSDLTYGIKGLRILRPFLFFVAVRLDRHIAKKSTGYLLVVEMERKKT